jgi:subtilisin family serine protease
LKASNQNIPYTICHLESPFYADVTSCEPDFLVSIDQEVGSASPNDPSYSKQWNMPDIQLPTAWKTGQFGSKNVRTCVIDTGIDFTHPDMIANLWMNPKEVNGPGATAANGYQNGIDDDGNGASHSPLASRRL